MRYKDVLCMALEAVLVVSSPVQNPCKDTIHDLTARYDSGTDYLDACGEISRSIKGLDYCESL